MNDRADEQLEYRSIPGGLLVQERDVLGENTAEWRCAAGPEPDDKRYEQVMFTWLVAKHLKSNAIAIAEKGRVLGVGCGQVDRVGACRHAIEKAGERLSGTQFTVAASDAFFPFEDGPRLLIEAGVDCIIHPGGSKRDDDTFALCEQHGVTCIVTGRRHFRH